MKTFTAIHVVISLIGIALYFNAFVLIVQLFQKVPALKALAPTQSEPPFSVTQLIVLIFFVVLAIAASIRFRVAANQELLLTETAGRENER